MNARTAVSPMRILIATDAFPPVCGGSGWSAYELARGLRERGHEVHVVQPRPRQPHDTSSDEYDGFRVDTIRFRAPNVPYLRNYCKNERLYAVLESHLREVIRHDGIDVIHAQHVLTSPPAVAAARTEGVPVVCTIRDYWPVCYWSDLIYDYASDRLCRACSPFMMTRCIRPRAGQAWPLAVPLIPYMLANLSRKQRALARADAVVAVSSAIARDLRARAAELSDVRIETIPNPVDVAAVRAAAEGSDVPLVSPYAIYVGKLARNKGVSKLVTALDHARIDWPVVIVGDGPERARLEAAARQSGRDVRFTGWLPRTQALAWLGHASLLIFPSHGPESLSRVLLEAGALGLPVAAMDTGGTTDIVRHEETGLLSTTAEQLGADAGRLARDAALRARLGAAIRRHVDTGFEARLVAARVEALYADLLRGRQS